MDRDDAATSQPSGDQVDRAAHDPAPIRHAVDRVFQPVAVRVRHIDAAGDLVVHGLASLDAGFVQLLEIGHQLGFRFYLPSDVIESGDIADPGRQLQKAVAAVTRLPIGLFHYRHVVMSVAGAHESGLEVRLPKIQMQAADLIIKMLRGLERADPKVDVAEPARFEELLLAHRFPRSLQGVILVRTAGKCQ